MILSAFQLWFFFPMTHMIIRMLLLSNLEWRVEIVDIMYRQFITLNSAHCNFCVEMLSFVLWYWICISLSKLLNLEINISRVHTQLWLKLTPNPLCGVGVNILPIQQIIPFLTFQGQCQCKISLPPASCLWAYWPLSNELNKKWMVFQNLSALEF